MQAGLDAQRGRHVDLSQRSHRDGVTGALGQVDGTERQVDGQQVPPGLLPCGDTGQRGSQQSPPLLPTGAVGHGTYQPGAAGAGGGRPWLRCGRSVGRGRGAGGLGAAPQRGQPASGPPRGAGAGGGAGSTAGCRPGPRGRRAADGPGPPAPCGGAGRPVRNPPGTRESRQWEEPGEKGWRWGRGQAWVRPMGGGGLFACVRPVGVASIRAANEGAVRCEGAWSMGESEWGQGGGA